MYIKLTDDAKKTGKNVFCPKAKVFLHKACTVAKCTDNLTKILRAAMAEGLIEKVQNKKEAEAVIAKELAAVTPKKDSSINEKK